MARRLVLQDGLEVEIGLRPFGAVAVQARLADLAAPGRVVRTGGDSRKCGDEDGDGQRSHADPGNHTRSGSSLPLPPLLSGSGPGPPQGVAPAAFSVRLSIFAYLAPMKKLALGLLLACIAWPRPASAYIDHFGLYTLAAVINQ